MTQQDRWRVEAARLLHACYDVLRSLEKYGDWDAWHEAGAAQVKDEVGSFLWPDDAVAAEARTVAPGKKPDVKEYKWQCARCRVWMWEDVPLCDACVAESPSPPVAPDAPKYGSEVLCERCAVVFCPHGEQLHFHHDGCPACAHEPELVAPDAGLVNLANRIKDWRESDDGYDSAIALLCEAEDVLRLAALRAREGER
jgi:hypothetical protein